MKKQNIQDNLINPSNFYNFLSVVNNNDNDNVKIDKRTLSMIQQYCNMSNIIQDAINNNKIVVYYQPIYNVKTKTFSGAEALVRLKQQNGKYLSPSKFIPIAEETKQIISIGKIVIESVCQFISNNDIKTRFNVDFISINLSTSQFNFEHPADFIIDTITKYNVDPTMIKLELTETKLGCTINELHNNINKLINFGLTVALDDFGTGRSNFDYLIDLPISLIKFDHIFTQKYFKDDKTKNIMDFLLKCCSKLDLDVVIEGIETDVQFNIINKIKTVKYLQGFYFSRPISEKTYIKFLSTHNS